MDLQLLSEIDEELDSSEVAELRFLCSDVLNRKRLEGVRIIKMCSCLTSRVLTNIMGNKSTAFFLQHTCTLVSRHAFCSFSSQKMSHYVFVNCTSTDHRCKEAVLETGGERAAGELFFPLSVASHYPPSGSCQPAEL